MKYLNSIKLAKKVIVSVIGFTVLLAGLAMIVLPGPAIIVIPTGIAILATEFVWAKRLLNKIKERIRQKIGNDNLKNDEAN
jgi:uncharacterized protein (TIGR02611 family)